MTQTKTKICSICEKPVAPGADWSQRSTGEVECGNCENELLAGTPPNDEELAYYFGERNY